MTNNNRLWGALLLLFVCFSVQAQMADQKRPAFYSLNSVGLVNGNESATLQVQTIEGIGYKNWFAGVGAGLDSYRYRTVPLFLDLRHQFGKTKNKWFVYADGGTALPWATTKQKNQNTYKDDFKRGNYYDIGAGYDVGLGKRHVLMLSAGYSRLNIREDVQNYYYDPGYTGLPNITPIDRYDYTLNRLIIKLGISL